MRIGLDISQIAHPGGVANYTINLSEQLSKISNLDLVFFYSSLRKKYQGELLNVRSFPLPPKILEILFNRFRVISIEDFLGELDIYHSSDWLQPKTRAKKVTTYHDLVPLKYLSWSHPKIVEVHKQRMRIVQEEVDMVIAVSKSTKKDLMEISHIKSERIQVIYEGVSSNYKQLPSELVESYRSKMKLPKEFVLAIGGVGNRRNLKRVKEACRKYNLVITGESIPWVAPDDIPLLYNSASVLLYPSLYEGFGLPILEAMASGTPVITSNVSSMPEVGGDAAEYVNPQSTIDIENKLRFVLKDHKKRESMIRKGFIQASKFTWEKCAEETKNLYERITNR